MKKLEISIIIPTYNSSENLELLFKSLLASRNKNFEVIVNDDKRTNDTTKELVKNYSEQIQITYIQENRIMSEARKVGSSYAKSPLLLHLDSDMQIDNGLITECVKIMRNKSTALIIPEDSFGTTFWAKCKYLEKKMYEGNDKIESLRCLNKNLYERLGGHDPAMIFSEDKDLDLRVRDAGVKIVRTECRILHNEGNLRLLKSATKKANYAKTANLFAIKHPSQYRWQINIFNRYLIYLRHFNYFFVHPILYIGVFIMKTVEFSISFWNLFKPLNKFA